MLLILGMNAVNEANPYQPPTAVDPPTPRRRFHAGPILSGLFAVFLATILAGPMGLLVSVLGVGSWWVYKFRPRASIQDETGAAEFLQRLESAPSVEKGPLPPSESPPDEPPTNFLGDLRL